LDATSFINIPICSYNTRKFLELPYHSFKLDKKEFETSAFLTNLTWLHDKINATGCVQLLLDIYLISPPHHHAEPQSPISNKISGHLIFLMNFIRLYFRSLNYDAQQIYSLLSTFMKKDSINQEEIANDAIIQEWKKEIEGQKILRIEKVDVQSDDGADERNGAADVPLLNDSNENGYDLLINTDHDENFIISMSTDREEICVWNVLK